ncbi:MAG: AMP-binding protein [Lentisphaeraceae bacterium]|nr:AMP-binding protein [Lentisphaeraceae bacterium]
MPKPVKLNRLIIELQNSSKTVTVGAQQTINGKDFVQDCSRLINRIKTSEFSEFVLSCKDSYLFAVGLFALLHEEKKICLPQGMEKGLIEELSKSKGFVSDFLACAIHPLQEESGEEIILKEFSDGQISLFTSGSTGERKEIKKTLSQFNEEISVLNQTWPLDEHQGVVSTVSHQHIYGLLFKILWPLASQRPFIIQDCLYENELVSIFTSYPENILVTCPAHLDAMVKFSERDFLKNRTVFSSGAPLSPETANAIFSFTGNSPLEVFGSTETGGIAWRRQSQSTDWTVMDNVELKTNEEKTLLVKSPFCEIQNEWYETGDKADIIDSQTFKHLGRKDRIVKVSGKRLSLDEMEQRLLNSTLVEECKVLVVTEKSSTARESTAAILTLTESGKTELNKLGRRQFAKLLKKTLQDFFTPVLLPRFWRYIEDFPKNSQGKLASGLLPLFLLGFDENENRHPELKSISQSSDTFILRIKAPKNCDFFKGHFPETPILPGVGQLFWAQLYAKKIFSLENVKGIKKLKFHHIIQPDDEVTLTLTQKNNSVEFTFSDGEKTLSGGLINYE